MYAPRLDFLRDFSRESGALLLKFSARKKTIFSKGGRDLVTSADHAVESLLFRRLKEEGFDDSVLSEERAPVDGPSPFRWIIDPLDGTSNFAHGNPLFCSSLALETGGKIVAGAVIIPKLQEYYYAERGKGAFLNGKRIRVSKAQKLYDLAVAVERQPSARQVEQSIRIEIPIGRDNRLRTLGSAAIDLCFTACGRFDAFFCTSIFAWDVAAGGLLVEEAGGKAGVLGAGKEFEFSRTPFGFAAGSKPVHSALLNALR
jgi:myo-inositol-1(or 4)-monophosphatase